MPARTGLYGSIPTRFDERDRPQVNGSLTYFKNGWAGSHSFKFGGEFQHEQQNYSTTAFGPSNLILYLNNNVPTQVDVYLVPNATRAVGRSKSVYLTDTWQVNSRLTFNLGFRFDRYTNYVPEQIGPQGHEFPQIERADVEPVGAAIRRRLRADRRSEDSGQGQLRHVLGEPGIHARQSGQSESEQQLHALRMDQSESQLQRRGPADLRRAATARSGDLGLAAPGPTSRRRSPTIPDLKDQYTHSASVFFEREIGANFGVRTGFVWNGVRNPRTIVNINQPFEAFNQPIERPESRARWSAWHGR